MSEELTQLKVKPVEPPFRQTNFPLLPELSEVDSLVRAGEARKMFGVEGAGCTAAVLDTGLNTTHKDFAGRVLAQANFTSDNGSVADDATDGQGHGTNVAGIVCAGDVHKGVAPAAGVVPVKVLDNSGSGSFVGIQQGLEWVRDNAEAHGITAVCMSLGDGSNRQDANGLAGDGIAALIDELAEQGIICCIAAGNDFFTHDSEQGMGYPAIFERCLSVGAVYDNNEGGFTYSSGAEAFSSDVDHITPFSQRLHVDVGGAHATDIFAPGAPVTSSGISTDMGSSVQHGTSQATPVVCGIVLLLQSFFRKATGDLPDVDRLRGWLRDSAVTINDGDNEDDNVVNTGLDYLRVDALAALVACARDIARNCEVQGDAA